MGRNHFSSIVSSNFLLISQLLANFSLKYRSMSLCVDRLCNWITHFRWHWAHVVVVVVVRHRINISINFWWSGRNVPAHTIARAHPMPIIYFNCETLANKLFTSNLHIDCFYLCWLYIIHSWCTVIVVAVIWLLLLLSRVAAFSFVLLSIYSRLPCVLCERCCCSFCLCLSQRHFCFIIRIN